jgi:hypothetical protein
MGTMPQPFTRASVDLEWESNRRIPGRNRPRPTQGPLNSKSSAQDQPQTWKSGEGRNVTELNRTGPAALRSAGQVRGFAAVSVRAKF